jgi:signal transduction histidine kinase/putative methionine-R-sulfoxide reductase with GAF domain
MDTRASLPGLSSADARRLEAFASIAAAVAHSANIDDALSQALGTTMDALELEAGGIYFVDEESGGLVATPHHRGLPADYPAKVARFRRGEGPIGRALDSVTPVAVRDITALEGVRDATRQTGLRSLAFVPLYARGRAVGMMAVGAYRIREFPPEELQVLGAVGGILGAAIENDRLVERAQGHLEQVQALWEIDRAVVEERDPAEVFDTIAREAGRLGEGDAVLVLLDGERDARIAASHGVAARAALGPHLTLDGTGIATLLRRGALVTVPLAGTARALVVLPLQAGGRIAGGLVVVRSSASGENEDALLSAFARRSAVALGKVEARQTEARRASQLALLAGASEIAASTLDLDVMLGAVARYVQQSFGYYSVSIYVVDRAARSAVLAGSAGVAAQVMPLAHRIVFGRGLIGWVAEHGQYLLANDVRKEPRFFAAHMTATLSELVVPVRLAGDVVAVINVESDQVDAFDDGDLLAIDGIAAQLASAIRNARLFEEKVHALRNLEILQDITNVLNSDLDLDALLDRIARRSVEALRPAQMGAVLLYNSGFLGVRSSFGYADDAALRRVRMDFHEGLPGSVFVSGQGRLVRCGPEDYGPHADAFREAAGGTERHSALCVPISLPQEKLGVLLLESATSPDAFQAEDLRFAATLSHQAAIAIGNALRLQRMLEMDRQRQAYLSNVSHELRTPLTVVQGYIEALLSGVGASDAHQYLLIAHDQSQKLGRMIEEVLEVARLEHGVAQRHLQWGPVALAQTVEAVVKALRQDAALKCVTVNPRLADGLPLITGDERLLRLLVMNLLENALKFSSRGGQVDIDLAHSDGGLLLRIRDRGIGIAPELHGRIFEKFFMVDGGATKSRSGAGIGLYLAREVVAIHDGSIAVESRAGEGACFEVRLPLHPRASPS